MTGRAITGAARMLEDEDGDVAIVVKLLDRILLAW
jgi:hypothetical protein